MTLVSRNSSGPPTPSSCPTQVRLRPPRRGDPVEAAAVDDDLPVRTFQVKATPLSRSASVPRRRGQCQDRLRLPAHRRRHRAGRAAEAAETAEFPSSFRGFCGTGMNLPARRRPAPWPRALGLLLGTGEAVVLQQLQGRVEVGDLTEPRAGQPGEGVPSAEGPRMNAGDPVQDGMGIVDDRIRAHLVEDGQGVAEEVLPQPGRGLHVPSRDGLAPAGRDRSQSPAGELLDVARGTSCPGTLASGQAAEISSTRATDRSMCRYPTIMDQCFRWSRYGAADGNRTRVASLED